MSFKGPYPGDAICHHATQKLDAGYYLQPQVFGFRRPLIARLLVIMQVESPPQILRRLGYRRTECVASAFLESEDCILPNLVDRRGHVVAGPWTHFCELDV